MSTPPPYRLIITPDMVTKSANEAATAMLPSILIQDLTIALNVINDLSFGNPEVRQNAKNPATYLLLKYQG